MKIQSQNHPIYPPVSSGKRLQKTTGQITMLLKWLKTTISMAIFNSFLEVYQSVTPHEETWAQLGPLAASIEIRPLHNGWYPAPDPHLKRLFKSVALKTQKKSWQRLFGSHVGIGSRFFLSENAVHGQRRCVSHHLKPFPQPAGGLKCVFESTSRIGLPVSPNNETTNAHVC